MPAAANLYRGYLYGKTKKRGKMEQKIFIVNKIEGEYAFLEPVEGGEELFIAMALLPPDVDLFTKLKYENLEFSVLS